MKISMTIPPTFSDDGERTLKLTVPKGWNELTQEQLRYVCSIMARFTPEIAKVRALYAFTGLRGRKEEGKYSIRVEGKEHILSIDIDRMRSLVSRLEWMMMPGEVPTRLTRICGRDAVDACLHEVPFQDYLVADNYYQVFIHTRNNDIILRMAEILYPGKAEMKLSKGEELSVFLWFAAVKNLFKREFPHLFRSEETADEFSTRSMKDAMNAQIRALTDGDVTKEKEVLALDCWRALTELNEKAREAKELKKAYKHG